MLTIAMMPAVKSHLHTILLIGSMALLVSTFSCRQGVKNKAHQTTNNASIEKGRELAITYCQSCHLLPDPSLLDDSTWEHGVLPAMGPRLGIFSYGFERYPSYKSDADLSKTFYPSAPALTPPEWQNIIDYYTALSPDSLPGQNRTLPVKTGLSLFKVEQPAFSYPAPAISFTKVDTTVQPRQLMFFDLATHQTLVFDPRLQLIDSVTIDAEIVNIDFGGDRMLACNIGKINPNNGKYGRGQMIYRTATGHVKIDTTATLPHLSRPVQITSCDLNNDHQTDYLVCEFGHLVGALSWMEYTSPGRYTRHVLRGEPGALIAYPEDYNHDGLMDVWALFSQGDEGIFLFTNKGQGRFEERQVLRFPPSYGSTHVEFADFNKDGFKDIVYTCGDNADFSMVLKPYHGVYIYLNDGKNNFKQQYFFPINGCYKAIARDFDNDGDLDIAAISFFADYARQPEEGFVYLQNEGNFKFRPFTIPETKAGRWLTMDAADLDGDAKTDLILGNFSIRPSVTQPLVDWKEGPPFIVLRNVGVHH